MSISILHPQAAMGKHQPYYTPSHCITRPAAFLPAAETGTKIKLFMMGKFLSKQISPIFFTKSTHSVGWNMYLRDQQPSATGDCVPACLPS